MAPFALSVRALSGGATLEVDGADTIATVKKKFDAALVEIGQEPMKGISLWHENARLDESRTLHSYGVGAGAVLQALATEHDVEVELREEREAEERARTLAERSFGWKANYGMLVSKAEGERRRREALEQVRQRDAVYCKIKALRIESRQQPIHLKQIQIFDANGVNVALASNGGSAKQSSYHMHKEWGETRSAAKLIDGNLSTNNHTAHGDEWVEVVLPNPTLVSAFAIHNHDQIYNGKDKGDRLLGSVLKLLDDKQKVVHTQTFSKQASPGLFAGKHTARFELGSRPR